MKNKPISYALLTLLLSTVILFSSCANTGGEGDKKVGGTSGGDYSGVLSNFTSEDVNGNAVDRSVFSGKKLTMVNIWATFCSPCIREMPELGELNREYAAKGVQVIGIVADITDRKGNISEPLLADAKEIIKATNADYLHIVPSASLVQSKLRYVSSVPETIFVDEYGRQVGKSYVGARSKEDWSKIIDLLLEQIADGAS